MENSELIKNFERVRDYMRQFYVYGFRSREEYSHKSPRSYDNERRRLESWLGKYMSFRREESGKQVFLSMDALSLAHNPLYQAFRAKSFTDKDITLHFYILDALGDGEEKSLSRLTQVLEEDYLSRFPDAPVLEMNTLRKKLKEYHALGLVRIRRQGKELLYSLPEESLNLQSWEDALHFFSEASPLGVIGSFLLDRFGEDRSFFRFKHHYLVHTLDSQILCQLLTAATRRERVILTVYGKDPAKEQVMEVLPCRVHISAQSGRQYLLGYVLCAWVVAALCQRQVKPWLAMGAGVLACYAAGAAWQVLMGHVSFEHALGYGVLPFIPGDVLKIAAANGLAKRLYLVVRA